MNSKHLAVCLFLVGEPLMANISMDGMLIVVMVMHKRNARLRSNAQNLHRSFYSYDRMSGKSKPVADVFFVVISILAVRLK